MAVTFVLTAFAASSRLAIDREPHRGDEAQPLWQTDPAVTKKALRQGLPESLSGGPTDLIVCVQ